MSNVLSPRDLVSRPDNMDETELSSSFRHEMSLVMREPPFCIFDNKDADQLRGNREADQRLCFRYTDSTIPPKFQASRHFLWLYSRVCVEPSRKSQRPVFSWHGSNCATFDHLLVKIVLYEVQFHGHHSYFRKRFPDAANT